MGVLSTEIQEKKIFDGGVGSQDQGCWEVSKMRTKDLSKDSAKGRGISRWGRNRSHTGVGGLVRAGRDKDWRAWLERLQKTEQELLYSPSPVDTLTQEHLRDPFPLREIQKLAERLLYLTSPNGTSRKRGDTISPRAPTPRHRPVRTGKECNQHPSSPRYHPRDRLPALQSQDNEGAGRLHSLRATGNQAGTGTKGTGDTLPAPSAHSVGL